MTDAPAPRVLVAGETLLDLVATDGSLATTDGFHARAGGAPANVAAGLAALGEPAFLWTRVGADGFGDRCRRTVADRGVPDEYVEVDPERQTSVAVAGDPDDADEDGDDGDDGGASVDDADAGGDDASFAFYRDADRHLGVDDAARNPDGDPVDPERALATVDVVVVGGISLATDPARSAVLDLLDAADAADCTIVFDPNARPSAWAPGEFQSVVERVLAYADVVKATPGDLAAAGFDLDAFRDGDGLDVDPANAPELARQVCEHGPHTTFLTLGADGAAAASTHESPFGRGGATHCGYDVDAVEPTGAGDAFLAAVVAELAGGATDPYAVLDVATATGALTTTTHGAIPSMPDRAAVDELVANDDAGDA